MEGGFRNPRINQISPAQVEEFPSQIRKPAEKFYSKLFLLLFSLHLLIIIVITIFLTVSGLIAAYDDRKFNPNHRYPPLLISCAFATITAFSWLFATLCRPLKAIQAAFWLSPTLTCVAGFLLLSTGSADGLVAAILALVFALVQSLYACWVTPRRTHAGRIVSVSLQTCINGIWKSVILVLLAATAYSCLWVSSVAGAVATGHRFTPLYVFVLLLSLAWIMQVIRGVMHVAISRVGYLHIARGIEIGSQVAFREACTISAGSICIGSVIVPIVEMFRGAARAINLVAGDVDEFLFSCAHCYGSMADWLVKYGNNWGFVYVGVYDKGVVTASAITWQMFVRVGMEPLIDSDLTGSFCFLCGVAAGSLCAIVGGSWVLISEKSFVTSTMVYTFLIGYFTTRIAMAWPQACVSAYHVAYAENPQNVRSDSTIADRIRELQPSQV